MKCSHMKMKFNVLTGMSGLRRNFGAFPSFRFWQPILFVILATFYLGSCDSESGATFTITLTGPQDIEAGEDLILSATASDLKGAIATYQWKVNGEVQHEGTDLNYTFSQIEEGTYKIQCMMIIDGIEYASNTLTITVTASQPVVRIAGGESVSANEDLILTTTVSGLNGAAATYQWKLDGNDVAGATGTDYTFNQPNNGSYEVWCVMTVDGTEYTSNKLTITVEPPRPAVSITGGVRDLIVINTDETFTATTSNLNGAAATYQWKLDGNNVAGATGTDYVFNRPVPSGPYSIQCEITVDGTVYSSNTLMVRVLRALPTVSISGDAMVVANDNTTIAAIASNLDGAIASYQWKIDNAEIPGATNPQYGFSQAVGGAYELQCEITVYNNVFTSSALPVLVIQVGSPGPGGGVVFYDDTLGYDFDNSGDIDGSERTLLAADSRFLEAAPSGWYGTERDPLVQWGAQGTDVPEVINYTSISGAPNQKETMGRGVTDTDAIVTLLEGIPETDRAAQLAKAYTGGGKDDWFLPSIGELIILVSQKDQVGGMDGRYWSTTEGTLTFAWYMHNNSIGTFRNNGKAVTDTAVRPIRGFNVP